MILVMINKTKKSKLIYSPVPTNTPIINYIKASITLTILIAGEVSKLCFGPMKAILVPQGLPLVSIIMLMFNNPIKR
jgi:hypothetical protein